jgi:hypothetical protein
MDRNVCIDGRHGDLDQPNLVTVVSHPNDDLSGWHCLGYFLASIIDVWMKFNNSISDMALMDQVYH